jgi:subtilisin family serine protease
MRNIKLYKNKILIIFITLVCCISILTIIIHVDNNISKDQDTINIINPYFYDNNLDNGLWGFDALNYTETVNKYINKKKLNEVTVAILDTGIDNTHPDLKDSIIEGYNFIENNNQPIDDNGHGTQIAGIIGGRYTGIAYGVKLMPIKVLNSEGFGKTEDLVNGIIWAVDNGADIINLSIGRRHNDFITGEDTSNELEYKAIQYAILNDVLIVTVTGDFSDNLLSYPAAYRFDSLKSSPIIVSSVDKNKEYAPMSNKSFEIDVVAPGEAVLTTMPKLLDLEDNDYANIKSDGYIYCRGTSFAAPYISGIAAIIKSIDSTLDSSLVKKCIIDNTEDLGEKGRDSLYGLGIPDLYKIVTNLNNE